ncbi:hypothetical protein [Paenisporosarcina cavernae]|uniref:Group-specific protein n=1 Tax=Paenisporosarcina cavernae TaxID=2320858 RepID=A0A385YQ30_9BACL|nr:hypothetical protein [Paenisporosarcina cavernae]AYC28849.1 hypothetical protein D3873_02790 [Paenisporosarcina cavernae]
MLKELPSGVKSSITRSITTVFENYMASIEWSEEKFSMESFVEKWREYINDNATWMEKISEDVKQSPEFHAELADKMNKVIEKILNEPPSEEQVASIEMIQEELGTHYDYACKAEASYVESILKQKQSS